MYVRKSEIVALDMTIEDAAKLIVSAGLVAPEVKKPILGADGQPIEIGNPPAGRLPQPALSKRTASSRPNK
jgi:uncharacterized membrane protein